MLVLTISLDLLPLPKNLDFSKTFLGGYTEIKGGILVISASLPFKSFEDLSMVDFNDLGVNLLVTAFLKETFQSLMGIEFQPAL